MRELIPLKDRKIDILFLAFFIINLLFITYIVDFEQIVIRDPYNFTYPLWPPRFMVDLIHWWGNNFDPVLMARPAWWMATIWWDALFFGPFYAFAIYAFIKGKEWIRIPAIIYSSVMLSGVIVILSEEIWGMHASPKTGMVLMANVPWLLIPVLLLISMWKREHPFTREKIQ